MARAYYWVTWELMQHLKCFGVDPNRWTSLRLSGMTRLEALLYVNWMLSAKCNLKVMFTHPLSWQEAERMAKEASERGEQERSLCVVDWHRLLSGQADDSPGGPTLCQQDTVCPVKPQGHVYPPPVMGGVKEAGESGTEGGEPELVAAPARPPPKTKMFEALPSQPLHKNDCSVDLDAGEDLKTPDRLSRSLIYYAAMMWAGGLVWPI
ncbi:hypothetical protein BDK51DRAFT_26915, partial [Blyttiomyces helicus]